MGFSFNLTHNDLPLGHCDLLGSCWLPGCQRWNHSVHPQLSKRKWAEQSEKWFANITVLSASVYPLKYIVSNKQHILIDCYKYYKYCSNFANFYVDIAYNSDEQIGVTNNIHFSKTNLQQTLFFSAINNRRHKKCTRFNRDPKTEAILDCSFNCTIKP